MQLASVSKLLTRTVDTKFTVGLKRRVTIVLWWRRR